MAAREFTLVTAYAKGVPTKTLAKDSATVIRPGTFVGLTSGLAVQAGAATAALAYSKDGAPAGTTEVIVVNDPRAEFVGTAGTNFAVADRGTEVDMSISSTLQRINLAASTTDVFKVSAGKDAGTVGSTAKVKVRINKFLY